MKNALHVALESDKLSCATDGKQKWAVFVLTCLLITTFISLSIFSLVETISLKIWEGPPFWCAKCSLPFPSVKSIACLKSLLWTRKGPEELCARDLTIYDDQGTKNVI